MSTVTARLADLLAAVSPFAHGASGDRLVSRVTRDSREAGPDSIFVAIRGANVDGHDLVRDLPDVAAVVAEREVDAAPGVPVVLVDDTRAALARLAAALHGFPSRRVPVIGVTGTNGKTTVTTLVEQAMLRLGRRVGRIGTTGVFVDGVQRPSALTTPEAPALQALLAELEGADAVVMEVSSIGLVQHRVDGIEFHVAAFTNLSHDHLDFHGTMDAYAAAKALLFQKLRPEGGAPRALLCVDDPAWVRMEPPDDRWTYGFAAGADVRVRSMSLEPDGRVRLAMSTPAGEVDLRTALIGRHNGQNLAASLGIGLLLGFELDAWAGALGEAPPVRGRLEPVENDRGIHVYVDYAHTPAGLSAALGAVREVARGDVFVVFGCGGDRDAAKRPVMGRLAEELADYAVVTSDNPRSEPPERILAEVVAGFDEAPALAEVDRARAIAWAITHARPGDVVLIAGKGHETYQEIRGTRTPFDDREVARAVLG